MGGSGAPRAADRTRYPDSQQLFVGNLPLDAKEEELKDFFSEFGAVLELRINTKGAGPVGQKVRFASMDFSAPHEKRQHSGEIANIRPNVLYVQRFPTKCARIFSPLYMSGA